MLFRTVIITQFVGFYNCFCSRCRDCFIFAYRKPSIQQQLFFVSRSSQQTRSPLYKTALIYKTSAAIGGRRFNGLVHQKIEYADVQRVGELIAIHFVAKQFFVLRVG